MRHLNLSDMKHVYFPINQYKIFLMLLYLNYRRRWWHPTPVLLPGKSHGQRSLVGCSPWGCRGSDMTERLHFHFSLSCIGEGNGNPLQCSCMENPRDRGAWWAAVHGVAQSRTRLKRLSSSMTRLTQLIFLFEEENLKMCYLLSMTMLLICKESLKFLLKSKQKN